MPRPKTGETPIRHVRIDDDRWAKVELAANEDGTTKSDVVKRAIDEHISKRERRKRRAT